MLHYTYTCIQKALSARYRLASIRKGRKIPESRQISAINEFEQTSKADCKEIRLKYSRNVRLIDATRKEQDSFTQKNAILLEKKHLTFHHENTHRFLVRNILNPFENQ